jgi:hypothetical protein
MPQLLILHVDVAKDHCVAFYWDEQRNELCDCFISILLSLIIYIYDECKHEYEVVGVDSPTGIRDDDDLLQ